jgi:hypothetical protein
MKKLPKVMQNNLTSIINIHPTVSSMSKEELEARLVDKNGKTEVSFYEDLIYRARSICRLEYTFNDGNSVSASGFLYSLAYTKVIDNVEKKIQDYGIMTTAHNIYDDSDPLGVPRTVTLVNAFFMDGQIEVQCTPKYHDRTVDYAILAISEKVEYTFNENMIKFKDFDQELPLNDLDESVDPTTLSSKKILENLGNTKSEAKEPSELSTEGHRAWLVSHPRACVKRVRLFSSHLIANL